MSNLAPVVQPISLRAAIVNPTPAHASVLTMRPKGATHVPPLTLMEGLVGDIHRWLVDRRKFPTLPLTAPALFSGVEAAELPGRAIVASRLIAAHDSKTWQFTLRHVDDRPAYSKNIWRVRVVLASCHDGVNVTTLVDCGAGSAAETERPDNVLATTPRFFKQWARANDRFEVTNDGLAKWAITNFTIEDTEQHGRIIKKLIHSDQRKIPLVLLTPDLSGQMRIDPEKAREALGTSSIVIGASRANFDARGGVVSRVINEVSGLQIKPAGVYVFLPRTAKDFQVRHEEYDMRSGERVIHGYLRRSAGDALTARMLNILSETPWYGTDLVAS
jgi:hypothetical protein